MQIQSIQATDNYRKPNFQAQFLRNKNFANFYDWVPKDNSFLNKMKRFTQQNPEQLLEIRSDAMIKLPGIDRFSHVFAKDEQGYVVKVLNHYTGKEKDYGITDGIIDNILSNLLDLLDKDKAFFANDEYAKTYRQFVK